MNPIVGVIIGIVGLALGGVAGYAYFRYRSKLLVESAEHQSERILAEAETKAKETVVQARDEAHKLRNEVERESKKPGSALRITLDLQSVSRVESPPEGARTADSSPAPRGRRGGRRFGFQRER